METVSENRSFGGTQGVYSHSSEACACDMTFGLFLPAAALICNMIANRFIRKDERLVRSVDRIR